MKNQRQSLGFDLFGGEKTLRSWCLTLGDREMQFVMALCNGTGLRLSRKTEYKLASYCGDMSVVLCLTYCSCLIKYFCTNTWTVVMAVLTAKLDKVNLKPVELLKAFDVSLTLDMNWGKWIRDLKIQIVPMWSTGSVLACPSNVRLLTTSLYKIL